MDLDLQSHIVQEEDGFTKHSNNSQQQQELNLSIDMVSKKTCLVFSRESDSRIANVCPFVRLSDINS